LNLSHFIQTNKRFLIWASFFFFLFLIRKLFGLVFLTFILCFIFNNIVDRLSARTKLPRRFWTAAVYIVFITAIIVVFSFAGPKVGQESTLFLRQLPETLDKFHNRLDIIVEHQPSAAPIISRIKESISIRALSGMSREALVNFVLGFLNQLTHYISYFFLGTLFSFFILFDLPNLRTKVMALRNTRFREIYDETAETVVRFAMVVGAAFQAQIMIACINTALTAIGLWVLGIHPISLLATIVFFCGLIPVLGTILSSVPLLLLAFNAGGIQLLLEGLVMILIVHTVETYVLNPNVFSAVLKINPVLTLMILYIGHNLFGFWGILLGVPISVYIYRYVLLTPE
jgi:predicted PurR-regulated permease PerM